MTIIVNVLKILYSNTLLLSLFHFGLTVASHNRINDNLPYLNELDFIKLAIEFCQEKPKINFCSIRNLKIMFEIEEERRQREKELEIQLKRMEQHIIRNILKMNKNFKIVNALKKNLFTRHLDSSLIYQ